MITLPVRLEGPPDMLVYSIIQIRGLMASLTLSKERHVKLNIHNVSDRVIQLKSETKMAMVLGRGIKLQKLGEKLECMIVEDPPDLDYDWVEDSGEKAAATIKEYLENRYRVVGDLSSHPITPTME